MQECIKTLVMKIVLWLRKVYDEGLNKRKGKDKVLNDSSGEYYGVCLSLCLKGRNLTKILIFSHTL